MEKHAFYTGIFCTHKCKIMYSNGFIFGLKIQIYYNLSLYVQLCPIIHVTIKWTRLGLAVGKQIRIVIICKISRSINLKGKNFKNKSPEQNAMLNMFLTIVFVILFISFKLYLNI